MVSNWAERVGETARDTVCSALATSENLAGFLDSLLPNGDWDNQIAGGIRRGFCGNPDDAPSPSDFQRFSGGQCPGEAYGWRLKFRIRNGATGNLTAFSEFFWNQPNRSRLVGPVSLSFIAELNQGDLGQIRISGQNAQFDFGGLSISRGDTYEDVEFEPNWQGDVNDNCGDPPPDIPPFQPVTINNPVTYVDNTNTEVTENYDFTVNIPVIIGGILIAPVTVAGNNFNLNLSVPINGDIRFEFGQNRSGDTFIEPGTDPGDPLQEPEGNETERRIIAVLVTATVNESIANATKILQNGNPTIYAPRLGSVAFYVAAGQAAGWTEDIPIKNLRSYIRCPVPQGAINVAGTPDTGVTFTLTKVFSSQESYRFQIGA